MTKAEKSRIQKEIVDGLEHKPHGRLLLAPRVGKTKIIIDLIKRDKPESILWVTPSAELADMNNTKDGIVSEFSKWGAKRYIKKLTTTTWASLSKIIGFYDMVVLDEEQHITENNSVNLVNRSIDYINIVSMTGTPTRNEEKKWIYSRLQLPILVNIPINKAVDIGLLANYEVNVIDIPMSNKKDIEAGNKSKKFMTTEIAQYNWMSNMVRQSIYQNRKDKTFRILQRMRAIKNSPSKHEAAKKLLSKLEGRILIFAATIKQAENLCSYTYHSKTDNKDLLKFKNGDIDRIAMVNAGGTGHTYKKIDHLIIVQADSDKNGGVSQKISRTLLQQKNYKATVWILSLLQTQDEKWVESALKRFDKSKVNYINYKNL